MGCWSSKVLLLYTSKAGTFYSFHQILSDLVSFKAQTSCEHQPLYGRSQFYRKKISSPFGEEWYVNVHYTMLSQVSFLMSLSQHSFTITGNLRHPLGVMEWQSNSLQSSRNSQTFKTCRATNQNFLYACNDLLLSYNTFGNMLS